METLKTAFYDYIKQVVSMADASTLITEDNIFQEGAGNILPFLDKIVDELVLPGSGVDGIENLEELLDKAQSGKSCLLLPEHYSNLDLSLISTLVKKAEGRGRDISSAIVAIAGMKLNEENRVVSAFASAYTRLIIYPSRSIEGLDPVKDRAELIRSNAINRAAMKKLMEIKTKGRLILVFPSGTRYRPWDPNTKQGVREIDSYIKSFDYMCPIALNGQVLHVHQGDMMEDTVGPDIVRITAGPVISCTEFRDKVRSEIDVKAESGSADKKQAVANAIMAMLEKIHTESEAGRQKLLKN
ncbi:MAG: 1-acyl-sn-glycerol-3-phosphate acyltransferase [Treponema sp.]|jgi:glycerol-3-phosphate O-acyltransferase|nr:1-acyl-sn-glycerol-3-phosphate acyltransferase [Treponema sp.]